jgi:hypothetical protein
MLRINNEVICSVPSSMRFFSIKCLIILEIMVDTFLILFEFTIFIIIENSSLCEIRNFWLQTCIRLDREMKPSVFFF